MSNIAIEGGMETKYKRSASPEFEGDGSEGTVGYLSSDGSSSGKSTKTSGATGGLDSDELDSDDSDNLPIVHYHKIAKKLDTSSDSSSWDSSDSEPLLKYKRDSGHSSNRMKRRDLHVLVGLRAMLKLPNMTFPGHNPYANTRCTEIG